MFNTEIEFSMNAVDTQWNNMFMAYSDIHIDSYKFEYDVNMLIDGPSIMPSRIPTHDERYVVQLNS